jgi:hypothetical protein
MKRSVILVAWWGALAVPAAGQITWTAQGPGPSLNGQVENISPNNEVSGAIHTVLAHPDDPDILYVGATNGGVWKTTNATSTSPNWTPLTDFEASLSIGSMAFDPTDTTYNTIVVGVGRYSSFAQRGGARTGLLRTTDGGSTWTALDGGGTLAGSNISGVVARGNTLVASVNVADSFTFGNIGIFRSTDGGATFNQVSTGDGSSTGLPGGVSYDLVADPTNGSVLYTSTIFSDIVGGTNGVYRSTDTGSTWTKVSDAAIDSRVTNSTSNLEIAVGNSGEVYVGVVNGGAADGFFRSSNGTGGWVQLDDPTTNENGNDVGLNPGGGKGPDGSAGPEAVAGGQGSIHFSVLADPDDAHTVYAGGDRQPLDQFPNSIGARDFTGRLFRGDATRAAGDQWVHLTHTQDAGGLLGGGTARNSAPHADSREMVFDANGDIIEVDDGGVYRRTSPTDNTGDWFSLNGDLQVTEIHDVAYDRVSNILISGNQDTGTTYQTATGSTTWNSLSTADGGDVLVDDRSRAIFSESIRYSSFQNLEGFRKTTWDANNNLIATVFPSLTEINGSPDLIPQFVTPLALNQVDPTRLLISASNGLYESFDQGQTIDRVSTVDGNRDGGKMLAYGGFLNGIANPDVIYAAQNDTVFVRTTAGGAITAATALNNGGQNIGSLVLNDDDWTHAFVLDLDQVFETQNAGLTWADITGDLLAEGAYDLRVLEFVDLPTASPFDLLLAGAANGVYFAQTDDLTEWTELGALSLPNVPVWDLEYDAVDDILVAGTLGRGAWTISNFSRVIPEPGSVMLLLGLCGLAVGRPRR